MKLYYTGNGEACIVYLPPGSLPGQFTASVTLRKEGLEYPDALAKRLLDCCPWAVSAKLEKIDIPETTKGGDN